jgi:hypothetical protein
VTVLHHEFLLDDILFRCHNMKPGKRDAAFNIYRCVCDHLGVDADEYEGDFVDRMIAAGAVVDNGTGTR